MEYLQIRIKNVERDDKCIIWRHRVQKVLKETCSWPGISQCLCQCSFLSTTWGRHCIKPSNCWWTRGFPPPTACLEPNPLGCTGSHASPAFLRDLWTSHSQWWIQNATHAANAFWVCWVGCSPDTWGQQVQVSKGAWVAPIWVPYEMTWEKGTKWWNSSIARHSQDRANHEMT